MVDGVWCVVLRASCFVTARKSTPSRANRVRSPGLHIPSWMMAKTHRELVAWTLAMDLAAGAYAVARRLPSTERFGLAAQIRGAAASVPANIAEGFGRDGRREFARFLAIANGSLKELETHLELCVRCELLAPTEVDRVLRLADRTGAVIRRLSQSLRQPPGRTKHDARSTSKQRASSAPTDPPSPSPPFR